MSSSADSNSNSWNIIIAILVILYIIFGNPCSGGSDDSFSNKKEECSFCYGKGEKNCYSCNGAGEKSCNQCYGQGKSTCSDCNGMGQKTAYVGHLYKDGFQNVNTNGISGYHQVIGGSVTASCQKCNSSGKLKCGNYSCDYGKIKCTTCYGKGKQTCTYCYGEGYK